MSFFFLGPQTDSPKAATLSRLVQKHGFAAPIRMSVGSYDLLLFGDAHGRPPLIYQDPQSKAWIGATGSVFFDGRYGGKALPLLLEALQRGENIESRCSGQFCLLFFNNDTLMVLPDKIGGHHVFHDPAARSVSDSYLAMMQCSHTLTLNTQTAYHYLWNGCTFGEQTLFDEISLLPAGQALTLDQDIEAGPYWAPQALQDHPKDISFPEIVNQQKDALMGLFESYFNGSGLIANSAISGGYDSRLILAILRALDVPTRLFVYGAEETLDVQIGRQVAQACGLHLEVPEKPELPASTAWADVIERNMVVFDAIFPTGLIDRGAEASDRLQRSEDPKQLLLSGAVGEIHRNFFYINNTARPASALIDIFFSRFDAAVCTTRFSKADYRQQLGEALAQSISMDPQAILPRTRLDAAYPLFRGRFWSARDSQINTRLGPSAIPFLEPAALTPMLSAPPAYKDYGRLQAALIQAIDPLLAKVTSAYGHNFASVPPRRARVRAWLEYQRPAWLRRRAYALRKTAAPWPTYLEVNTLGGLFPEPHWPFMRHLVHMERMWDPEVMARAASLEYLCQRFGAEMAD